LLWDSLPGNDRWRHRKDIKGLVRAIGNRRRTRISDIAVMNYSYDF
jgi:hypothetical protein